MESMERKVDELLANQRHIWSSLNTYMSITLILLGLILWRAW